MRRRPTRPSDSPICTISSSRFSANPQDCLLNVSQEQGEECTGSTRGHSPDGRAAAAGGAARHGVPAAAAVRPHLAAHAGLADGCSPHSTGNTCAIQSTIKVSLQRMDLTVHQAVRKQQPGTQSPAVGHSGRRTAMWMLCRWVWRSRARLATSGFEPLAAQSPFQASWQCGVAAMAATAMAALQTARQPRTHSAMVPTTALAAAAAARPPLPPSSAASRYATRNSDCSEVTRILSGMLLLSAVTKKFRSMHARSEHPRMLQLSTGL